jgi:hypothetical protein
MPGTIGDSEGVLHERLGSVPATDEEIEVFEPGQKERENENSVETDNNDFSVDELVNRI